jgi:hypothetical protein
MARKVVCIGGSPEGRGRGLKERRGPIAVLAIR